MSAISTTQTSKSKRILLHVVFWLTYLLWGGYVLGSYDGNFNRSFMNDLIHLPLKMMITYFIMYYILPRYMETKKYGQLTIIFSALVVFGALAFRFTIYKIIQPV